MARPPSAASILRNEKKNKTSFEPKNPIASEMYLPNHSGDHSAGIVNTTPTIDNDIVNKKYVDDEISDNTFWKRLDAVTLTPKLIIDGIEVVNVKSLTGNFNSLDVDTLNFDGNEITDSTGTISFGDENLTTTGDVECNKIKTTTSGEIGTTLGVGTTPSSLVGLNVVHTTNGAASGLGLDFIEYVTEASANGRDFRGMQGRVFFNDETYKAGEIVGIQGIVDLINGEGGASEVNGGFFNISTGWVVDEINGIKVLIDDSSKDSETTNMRRCYLAQSPLALGDTTNEYGLYIEDVEDGGTLNYAIYTNNGVVHFGDNLEVDGITKLGDGGTTNYTEIDNGGFIESFGSAIAWKDINLGSALLSRPSSSQPDIVSFVDETGTDTNIETYGFAVGEKVHGGFEMQHDYKEGSDFTFHVHWQGITAPSGTDNVQWRLTYTVLRDGQTLDAVTIIDSPDTPFDTQYEAVRSDFTAITGTNYNIGDQFVFTLERVAATGDAYAGDALIATTGIHYQVNTLGSRTIAAK